MNCFNLRVQGGVCNCPENTYWSDDVECCITYKQCLIYDSSCAHVSLEKENFLLQHATRQDSMHFLEMEMLRKQEAMEGFVCQ